MVFSHTLAVMSSISCSTVDCNSTMFQGFYLAKTSTVEMLYFFDILCYRERSTSPLRLFSLIPVRVCVVLNAFMSSHFLLFSSLPSLPSPLPSPSPLALQLLCIITEKEEHVGGFKDYQEPTTSSPPLEKVLVPTHTGCASLLNALWVCQTHLLSHLQAAPQKDVPVAPPPPNLPHPLMSDQCPSHLPPVCL